MTEHNRQDDRKQPGSKRWMSAGTTTQKMWWIFRACRKSLLKTNRAVRCASN